MSRNSSEGTVSLKGNVQIVFQNTYLAAQSATIDMNKKTIIAEGYIVLQNPNSYIEAERIEINYETKKGFLKKAFVQSGQVIFEGELIEKTGEDTYVVEKGNYTPCKTCPPAWSFSGQRVEAEIGGYADIKYPILRFAGVPVLWLPRIIVPLKSSRQSGLLEPRLEIGSQSGVSIAQSHFWAISKSSDFTTTAKYYENRGWKGLGEYRYVLSEESKGQLNGAFIDDKAFRDKTSDPESKLQRGFVNYNHYFALPEGFVQRAQIKHVSDLRYLRDFSEEIEGHGDPALENNLSLTKNTERQNLTFEASFYRNLLQEDALADNRNAVHRFPQIHYALMETRVLDTDFLFSFDFDFVNFARDDSSYDDIDPAACAAVNGVVPTRCVDSTPDGEFNPDRDLIRSGQRFDFHPRISYPFKLWKVLDVEPRLSYRETQYAFFTPAVDNTVGYSPSAFRRYLQTDLLVRTQFDRVFTIDDNPRSLRYKHILQPEIEYSAIPWLLRPDHPFFGNFTGEPYSKSFEQVTDQDFFGSRRLQFDYYDRVFAKRLINFGVTNRLLRKTWSADQPVYENIATFKLNQSYDFEEVDKTNPHPLSSLNGLLSLRFFPVDSLTTASYFPYANIANYSTRIRLSSASGTFGEVSYSLAYILDEDNTSVPDPDNRTENLGLSMGFNGSLMSLIGTLNYSAATYNILSWQYVARLKPPGNCWGFDIGHKQDIGSADVKFVFNFNLQYGGI